MKTLFILIALLGCVSVQAQSVSTRVTGNASLTNYLNVTSRLGTKLFLVTSYNNTTNTAYVQIFQTATNPPSGTVPTYSYPIAGAQFLSYDFSYYGADLDAITICISTNLSTLGLATPNYTIQTVTRSN